MSSTGYLLQLEKMRNYFQSGATKSYAFRKEQLLKLKSAVLQHEDAIYAALYADLKRTKEETWVTETGFLLAEINNTLKHLKQWMRAEQVATTLVNFPSRSFIMNEPLGVVLIISPWNYPFQLLLAPMVGAIAAGNCVVLKASEFAPATAAVIKKIAAENFSPEFMLYTEGDGAEVVPGMINNFRFDHIFYTGNTAVGKIIYKMAAEQLVPVTLELGGKSPCIVEWDADIKVAARRIAMTKFSNAGQMCVAPDYLLVHHSVKANLVDALKETIRQFFSDKPISSESYAKIINEKQFNRIVKYLDQATVVFGGSHSREHLHIAPTIVENVSMDSALMNEEIFGPILPIISFSSDAEAKKIIQRNPDPLALYVFTSSSEKEKYWLESISFGGGCINNASWHLTNHHLPFGGRGNSGIGRYHGRKSFDTFTHKKAVMKTPTWFDPLLKYPPFKGKLSLFKWIVR